MASIIEIYEECKANYEKLYKNIRGLAIVYEALNKDSFSADNCMIEFDIVLQYSLLQIACADMNFSSDEMEFIRRLTKSGDFVEFMNKQYDTDVTWEDLVEGSVETLRKVLKLHEDNIGELAVNFGGIFAAFDSMTKTNYIDEFEEDVCKIILGVASMDGEVTQDELDQDCLMLKLINFIRETKEEMK